MWNTGNKTPRAPFIRWTRARTETDTHKTAGCARPNEASSPPRIHKRRDKTYASGSAMRVDAINPARMKGRRAPPREAGAAHGGATTKKPRLYLHKLTFGAVFLTPCDAQSLRETASRSCSVSDREPQVLFVFISRPFVSPVTRVQVNMMMMMMVMMAPVRTHRVTVVSSAGGGKERCFPASRLARTPHNSFQIYIYIFMDLLFYWLTRNKRGRTGKKILQ